MANTKTPEYNTHQLVRVPIDSNARFDPERNFIYPVFENCFPTLKNKEVILTKRAPNNEIDSFTADDPRSMIFDPENDYLYVAYSNDLKVYTSLNGVSVTSTANVFTITEGPIGWATYKVGSTSYVISHEPGASSNIRYWSTGTAGSPTSTTNLAIVGMSSSIVVMDGYIFVAGGDGDAGQRIYNSTLGAPTTISTGADFIDAEMYNDRILALAKHQNHLVAFGKESIEFFYNAANEIGSPLQRQVNYSQRIGITTIVGEPPLLVEIGDVIYFAGGESGAYNGIYKLENFKITKVSDLWVDSYLSTSNANSMKLNVYEHLGVSCLMINNGTANLIYKPDVDLWSVCLFNGKSIVNTKFGSYRNEAGVYFLYSEGADIGISKSGYRAPQSVAQASTETLTATYAPRNIDFGNNSQKHFKWVDVIGWFGTNTVTLFYTNKQENVGVSFVSCGAKDQDTQGTQNPLRWRNLGRSRAQRYSILFSGNSDMEFRGIEIAYNLGTY